MTIPEARRPEIHRPDLYRPVRMDRIGAAGLTIDVQAEEGERAALAARLRIPAVRALACRFTVIPVRGGVFRARGQLQARLVRTCVVSLDDFETDLEETFSVLFVPSGSETYEIDPESEDEIPYMGDLIDLGEAATEQLALSLDPYPRRPDAELPDSDGAVEERPFAALAALRRRT